MKKDKDRAMTTHKQKGISYNIFITPCKNTSHKLVNNTQTVQCSD